jgi:hypothetical protein
MYCTYGHMLNDKQSSVSPLMLIVPCSTLTSPCIFVAELSLGSDKGSLAIRRKICCLVLRNRNSVKFTEVRLAYGCADTFDIGENRTYGGACLALCAYDTMEMHTRRQSDTNSDVQIQNETSYHTPKWMDGTYRRNAAFFSTRNFLTARCRARVSSVMLMRGSDVRQFL